MTREEFKQKFLTDAFYFVDSREEFETLQKIGLEFGIKNPSGAENLIEYDLYNISPKIAPKPGVKIAKNLTFFPDNRFQKSGSWYGEPKRLADIMPYYESLT